MVYQLAIHNIAHFLVAYLLAALCVGNRSYLLFLLSPFGRKPCSSQFAEVSHSLPVFFTVIVPTLRILLHRAYDMYIRELLVQCFLFCFCDKYHLLFHPFIIVYFKEKNISVIFSFTITPHQIELKPLWRNGFNTHIFSNKINMYSFKHCSYVA